MGGINNNNNEVLLNFDVVKNFMKYFPHNNVNFVVEEANNKIYQKLRRKKKGYLFDRMNLKENTTMIMKEVSQKSLHAIKINKIMKESQSPKKNILRKKSESGNKH